MENEDGELFTELLKQSVVISNEAAKYLENLIGRISHYALYILCNEYININQDSQNDNCCCIVKQNLQLPCRHTMMRSDVPISLESIYPFWHIYEEGKYFENFLYKLLETYEVAVSGILTHSFNIYRSQCQYKGYC